MKSKFAYLIIVVHVVLLFSASWNTSMTRDEEETIAAGSEYWSSWDFSRDSEQPPLVKLLVGLPQKLFPNANYRLRLFLSRLPIMLFSAFLAFLLFTWGKKLANENIALVAVIFYAFNIDILAHAQLATFDIMLSFFFILTLFLFHKAIQTSSTKYAVYAGLSLGLAFLSKFVALHLFFLLPMLSLLFLHKKMLVEDWKKSVFSFLPILAITFVVSTVLIGFVYIGQWDTLREGLLFQANHAAQGNDAFLMGKYSLQGWWYYFPIVFLIKSSIPLLLLIIVILMFYRSVPSEIKVNNWFLFFPFVYWWLFMMFINHVNIGIRYLLPVYPLLFLLLAQTISLQKLKQIVVIILLGWYVAISLFVFPSYVSYFNEIIGGPKNGYFYVIDSNIDWGQDLLRLKQYVKVNNLTSIHVSLYGPEEWLFKDNQEITCQDSKGWFAVSVNRLVGFHKGLDNCLRHVRSATPVDNVGNSILIYNVS